MSEVADGPETKVTGRWHASDRRRDQSHRFWDRSDDLPLPNDAEVVIGNERQSPTTLTTPAVEDDRSGLGDREGAASQRAVHLVKCRRVESACDEVGLCGPPLVWQVRWHGDAP